MSSVSRPPTVTARYVLQVASIAIVGVALSVAIFIYSRRAQTANIEAEFALNAASRHALTREVVNHSISSVFALKSLFQGSGNVSRKEFHAVAQEIIGRYGGITALQWIPIVPSVDRERIEAAASREIGRAFQFTEVGSELDHPMVRARDRDEHFPILYVEPLATNERAFGFDVQTAATRPFLEQARTSGQLVVTAQFALVQAKNGIVIACPVYTRDPSGESECVGFVQGVFRVEELFERSFQRQPTVFTDALFVDDTANEPTQRLLYYRPAHRPAQGAEANAPLEAEMREGLHRELELEYGGRRWLAIYRPSADWLDARRTHTPELWLGSSLLITALIASLVSAIARRATVVESLVTERTAELEESRRHLDNLLHAVPGMAFRIRYDGQPSVLFASEGAFALTGCRPEEFMEGRSHFRDFIHPDDLERVREATRIAIAERRDLEVEYRLCPVNGREKWVLSRGRAAFTSDGGLLYFEGLAIDITARKKAEADKLALERKLLESQKLESLGLLAGGIAHDFNNLLTGIMGHASLARHHPGLESATSDHLRKIESGASRAAELCQQMLAYSGRGQFLVETVDLPRLVTDTLPLLRGSLSPHARLELALSPRPSLVRADATQMRQILMNLILNAGDALGAAGGEIVVATGRRYFDRALLGSARVGDQLPAGEYVFLEVRDTGCGMTPETLAKIFDPFFTTKFTGRGLGLAAVLGIVRAHSGALHVRSELSVGTTFTLVLPAGPETAPTPRSTPSATPWQQKGRVLVIDDEAPVREIAAQLIATFGFNVTTASDGHEGVKIFQEDPHSFDLVFLDLTMPGFDGEETLAALRETYPQVRVILASGYSENERVTALAHEGPLVFLPKPFTRRRLQEKLREILGTS